MSVKTAISLKERVYKKGKEKANRLFGGNFSGYVSYLISRDIDESQQERMSAEQPKDNRIMSAIDEILDI